MAGDKVELRGFIDPLVIEVLDAIHQATGKPRMVILEPILIEWARGEIHKSRMILNVTNSNGIVPEPKWKGGA